jgi:cytochrome P450
VEFSRLSGRLAKANWFVDRFNTVVFGNSILAAIGSEHRKQKKMLTPAFTNAHMREIVPIFHGVVQRLRKTLTEIVREGQQEVDLLQWSTRAAVELIGQGGLGWSFDKLEADSEMHPYPKTMKEFGSVIRLTSSNLYLSSLVGMCWRKFWAQHISYFLAHTT